MAEQSINIPQVVVFLVVIFLASRWYFSKPSTSSSTRAAPTRPRLNHAQIDQIAQMFPQASRRDIAWDLQRNGGNAAATTERVLSGRGLDVVSLYLYLLGFHLGWRLYGERRGEEMKMNA